MADDDDGGYEVGYGKPPKYRQFVPGVSGFKGRKKKRPEAHAEIVARIRDEEVIVNGKPITKFELAIQQVYNRTIKSGKTSDLKIMFELLDKYGALPSSRAMPKPRPVLMRSWKRSAPSSTGIWALTPSTGSC